LRDLGARMIRFLRPLVGARIGYWLYFYHRDTDP
jgi:hypothetical protein